MGPVGDFLDYTKYLDPRKFTAGTTKSWRFGFQMLFLFKTGWIFWVKHVNFPGVYIFEGVFFASGLCGQKKRNLHRCDGIWRWSHWPSMCWDSRLLQGRPEAMFFFGSFRGQHQKVHFLCMHTRMIHMEVGGASKYIHYRHYINTICIYIYIFMYIYRPDLH